MLVLSRAKNQTIHIGEDVEVVVVEIRGDKVRLGVTAPRELAVHRREVFDQLHGITREIPRQCLPEGRRAVLHHDEQDAILARDGQLGHVAESISDENLRDRIDAGEPIHAMRDEMDLRDAQDNQQDQVARG